MNNKVDLAEVIALSKKVAIAKDKVVSDLNAVSKRIDQINSMESFTGKAATSAKNYFMNGHQTIIASFQQLFIHIHENLDSHIEKFLSIVDSSESARIKSYYIQDLKEGIHANFSSLEELAKEGREIIDSVSDLVFINTPRFSEVRTVKNDLFKTLENLETNMNIFSSQERNNQIEEMLHHINALMKELKTQIGEARFVHLNTSTIAIDSLKEMLFTNEGPFFSLFNKMANGEVLTPDERDMLYNFFQNIYLDKDTKNEIEEMATFINGKDIEKLKDRLNEKVVMTKDTLGGEMAMILAYVFVGTSRPSETNIDRTTRAKLETYFMLLKNYHSAMEEWDETVARVDLLTYKENPDEISGHFLESRLRIGPYRHVDRGNMTMKEYRDYALRDYGLDGDPVKFYHNSEVTYYTKANATSTYKYLENKKLIDEYANYTNNFITMKIINKIVGKMGKTAGIIKTIEDYEAGKRKLEKEITIGEVQEIADQLSMEFTISENETIPLRPPAKLEVQLYPTGASYDILARWKEAYEINPNIPYPEGPIEALEWKGINDFLIEHDTEIWDDLSDYITEGTLSEKQTIDEIAKNND